MRLRWAKRRTLGSSTAGGVEDAESVRKKKNKTSYLKYNTSQPNTDNKSGKGRPSNVNSKTVSSRSSAKDGRDSGKHECEQQPKAWPSGREAAAPEPPRWQRRRGRIRVWLWQWSTGMRTKLFCKVFQKTLFYISDIYFFKTSVIIFNTSATQEICFCRYPLTKHIFPTENHLFLIYLPDRVRRYYCTLSSAMYHTYVTG